MKKVIASLLVVAGLAATAQAAPGTEFKIQLSRDGVSWVSNLDISTDNPRTGRIFARVVVSYIQNDGAPALFLNGTRFQPVVSNWNPALDTALSIGDGRSRITPSFGAVPVLGRTLGGATLGTIDAVVAHQSGSTLRYAAQGITNAPGVGSGSNNVDGSRGISTSNNTLSPTLGNTDLVLFVFGMDTSTNQATRTLNFDVPIAGLRRFVAADETQGRGADWVTSTSPFTAARTVPTTVGATLTVPAPASLALLGLGGLVTGRRRR
jgi:hypothetical protein